MFCGIRNLGNRPAKFEKNLPRKAVVPNYVSSKNACVVNVFVCAVYHR